MNIYLISRLLIYTSCYNKTYAVTKTYSQDFDSVIKREFNIYFNPTLNNIVQNGNVMQHPEYKGTFRDYK